MATKDYMAMANAWYTQLQTTQSPWDATFGSGTLSTASSMGAAAQQQMNTMLNGAVPYESPFNANGAKTLETIKGAIHVIKSEAVSEETRASVETKADKYERAGFAKQAEILKNELKARIRLARIKEWDYKVLPASAINQFNMSMFGGYQYRVHIDPIEKYIGVPEGELKTSEFDKIVPEHVVDSLLEAQKRQVFDEFSVLWVEKVKDPLLLGKIKELPDYFLVDEWGDDVTFSDIIKASKESK